MEDNKQLPSEVSIWSKIRTFLCQEVSITDTELVLTPKQEKVFNEVYSFWNQEITGESIKNFLFKEVEIIDNITL